MYVFPESILRHRPLLENLTFSYQRLTTIPDLGVFSSSMKHLDLTSCRLVDLHGIAPLAALEVLLAPYNHIEELPGAWEFPQLREVRLGDNEIETLPDDLGVTCFSTETKAGRSK